MGPCSCSHWHWDNVSASRDHGYAGPRGDQVVTVRSSLAYVLGRTTSHTSGRRPHRYVPWTRLHPAPFLCNFVVFGCRSTLFFSFFPKEIVPGRSPGDDDLGWGLALGQARVRRSVLRRMAIPQRWIGKTRGVRRFNHCDDCGHGSTGICSMGGRPGWATYIRQNARRAAPW